MSNARNKPIDHSNDIEFYREWLGCKLTQEAFPDSDEYTQQRRIDTGREELAPGSNACKSPQTSPRNHDPRDAKFRIEYSRNPHLASSFTLEEYIAQRRTDEGIDPLVTYSNR